jgi:hypothetical protein
VKRPRKTAVGIAGAMAVAGLISIGAALAVTGVVLDWLDEFHRRTAGGPFRTNVTSRRVIHKPQRSRVR